MQRKSIISVVAALSMASMKHRIMPALFKNFFTMLRKTARFLALRIAISKYENSW